LRALKYTRCRSPGRDSTTGSAACDTAHGAPPASTHSRPSFFQAPGTDQSVTLSLVLEKTPVRAAT
jgi:hypothetical protein